MNKLLLNLLLNKPTVFLQMAVQQKVFKNIKEFRNLCYLFQNKKGIEIGGPSNMFKNNGELPIYKLASVVDGCNFSDNTAWEGKIEAGNTYDYGQSKKGNQFICDGVDVPIIPTNEYDFVLSCNNLEHIANPLKAVKNWLALLKKTGVIVLILPRKESNFDHKRPTTTFQHLKQDFDNNIAEDDLTCLNEVLQLHDLRFDPLAGNAENFKNRCLDNFNNRCLHHHVFDKSLLEEICNYFDLQILLSKKRVDNYIVIAKK